jgi:hypothetical protein
LKVGDRVLRSNGKWTRITRIEYEQKQITVYNFEVEGNHSYFVGDVGVLSHNCAIKQAISAFKEAVIPAERIAGADWNKVNDLVNAMRQAGGWVGDPAKVTNINGKLILIDGHHRVHAAMEAGVDVVYQMVRAEDLPQEVFRTAQQIANDARNTGGWSVRP